MSSTYNYGRLGDGEFRVMTLARGERQDPLKCQIDHLKLPNHPKPSANPQRSVNLATTYDALSYAWGTGAFTADLECDGTKMKITESLSTCLKCLRPKDADIILWVDQICINQGDLQERSSQVCVMGDIYRNAATVISWLGDDPEGHSLAFKEFLADIHLDHDGKPDVSCFVRNHLPGKESPKWKALNIMMSLPYFTRVWIMQEVILSTNVTFRWGALEFDFLCLRGFVDAASTALKRYEYDGAPISRISVHQVMSLTHFPPTRSFESIIYRVTHRQSTDQRDRIYAILSIVEDGPDIVPDYSMSAVDVFRDVTLKVISLRKNLNVLSSVFHSDEGELNPAEWPTWIPRWDGPIPTTIIELYPNFCASGPNSDVSPLPQNMGRYLDIHGSQLAGIRFVGFVPQGTDYESRLKDSIPKIWDAWKFASSFEPTIKAYGSLFLRSFTWTLLCGWPENNEMEEMANGWSKNQIFQDFASFWADHLARTVRYLLCEHRDPVLFVNERIVLADILALQFRAEQEATSDGSRINWKKEVANESDSSEYQRYRSGLCAKMQQKYDKSKSALLAQELAYFYPGGDWQKVSEMWGRTGCYRTFFVLSDGHIGMGPLMMKETDIIVILSGGRVPYALRPLQECFMFLGECYVFGLMHGNLDVDGQEKTFRLL